MAEDWSYGIIKKIQLHDTLIFIPYAHAKHMFPNPSKLATTEKGEGATSRG